MSRTLIQDADEFIKAINKHDTSQNRRDNREKKSNQQKLEEDKNSVNLELTKPALPTISFKTGFWPEKEIDFRRDIITYIETFYNKYGSLPNRADFEQQNHLKSFLPKDISSWKELLLELQEPLTARGITPYETPSEYLEPNFVLAVNFITNPYDKRTVAAKLKEAGLTTKQWSGFMRKPEHKEYYQDRLNTIFDEDTQNDAKLALQRLISAGDLQAIKHFHELQNIYRPSNQNNQIMLILQAIMEILALHVSPEILGRVAQDIRQSQLLESTAS